MKLIANFMKMFKFSTADKPKTKPFSIKLCEAVDRAEKARKSILYSIPDWDRLQIADEILCIIDDLQELQTIKTEEEKEIWKTSQFVRPYPGSF